MFTVGLLCARSMLGPGVPQVREQSALIKIEVAQNSNKSEHGQLRRGREWKPGNQRFRRGGVRESIPGPNVRF